MTPKLYCIIHNRSLTAISKNGSKAKVHPCPDCLNERNSEGYNTGYNDGYRAGCDSQDDEEKLTWAKIGEALGE